MEDNKKYKFFEPVKENGEYNENIFVPNRNDINILSVFQLDNKK